MRRRCTRAQRWRGCCWGRDRRDASARRIRVPERGLRRIGGCGGGGRGCRAAVREGGHARVRLARPAGPAGGSPSLLIQARPATDYPASLYERGMSALTASARRNETSLLSRVKSLNCLENLLASERAQAAGADTALLLNTRGLL